MNDVVKTKIENSWWDQEWEIEKNFQLNVKLGRLCQTWQIPLMFSLLYLIIVFGGKRFMATRSSLSLRFIMFLWSSALAIFSIIGTLRTVTVGYRMFQHGGMRHIVCDPKYFDGPITRMWAALFLCSKFVEYIDTAFIILRKQRLIFLHWYHHLTVALFSWLMYGGKYPGGYVFMTLNYIVHSFMYTYYAARATGFRPPKICSIIVTSLQIVQMVIGCWVMVAVLKWNNSTDCISSDAHRWSGSLIYLSYLLLFMHFFYNSYVVDRRPKDLLKEVQKNGTSRDGASRVEGGASSTKLNKSKKVRRRKD